MAEAVQVFCIGSTIRLPGITERMFRCRIPAGFHVGLPKELIALPIRVCYNIKDCGQENVPETTEKNISSSWWFFQ